MNINLELKEKYPALYEASLKEFSSTSYDNASLNKILKDAKMSKGSFYHNIGDKYTLYLMLIGCIAFRKIEIFKQNLENNTLPSNFFEKLRFICKTTYNFMSSEPLLNKLFVQFTKETPDFLEKMNNEFPQDDKKYWYDMISEGIKKGELRSDFPENVIIAFLDSAIKGLTNVMQYNMTSDDYSEAVINYINLLEDALKAKKE